MSFIRFRLARLLFSLKDEFGVKGERRHDLNNSVAAFCNVEEEEEES